MKTAIYIVVAYRWGNREKHSYTVAAFSKKAGAIKCAEDHTTYRGGKYGCAVEEVTLDQFDNDKDDYTKEVYRTKSKME